MPSTKSNEEPQADTQPPKRRVMRNTLNDLTAKEWLPETISVWMQKGLGAKHPDTAIEREHPAPFSFTDVARLVRFFTKEGAVVLDPFVGVGSTLKACALNGREGIGIELNPRYAELSRQRLLKELEGLKGQAPAQTVLEGDAREVLLGLATGAQRQGSRYSIWRRRPGPRQHRRLPAIHPGTLRDAGRVCACAPSEEVRCDRGV
jgi:hypothetical protein